MNLTRGVRFLAWGVVVLVLGVFLVEAFRGVIHAGLVALAFPQTVQNFEFGNPKAIRDGGEHYLSKDSYVAFVLCVSAALIGVYFASLSVLTRRSQSTPWLVGTAAMLFGRWLLGAWNSSWKTGPYPVNDFYIPPSPGPGFFVPGYFEGNG